MVCGGMQAGSITDFESVGVQATYAGFLKLAHQRVASNFECTMRDHEMRISSSKHASSSMSCSELASRSKASKRERPCLSAAAEMGAWIPAKTSRRSPPLMWGSTRSSTVRAMLGGSSELPVLSRCRRARGASWVGSAECYRLRDCTVRRSGRSGLRTVSGAIGRTPRVLAGSLLRRIHARTDSCQLCRGPVGICGRFACFDALSPNYCGSSPCPSLYPFFWVVPPYAA